MRFRVLQIVSFVFVISLIVTAASLPLEWIGYRVSLAYHISTQTTASWIRDHVIDFWISFPLFAVCACVLLADHKAYKNGGFTLGVLLCRLPCFVFLQPVVIDPLYNDFYPLKDKELESKILSLADRYSKPCL